MIEKSGVDMLFRGEFMRYR